MTRPVAEAGAYPARRRMNRARFASFASGLALAGCMVGPDYVPPPVLAREKFKELKGNLVNGWKLAAPRDRVHAGRVGHVDLGEERPSAGCQRPGHHRHLPRKVAFGDLRHADDGFDPGRQSERLILWDLQVWMRITLPCIIVNRNVPATSSA